MTERQIAETLAKAGIPFAPIGEWDRENFFMPLDMHRFRSANDFDGQFKNDTRV